MKFRRFLILDNTTRSMVRLFSRISSDSDPTKIQTEREARFLDFWACTPTGIRTTHARAEEETDAHIYTRKRANRGKRRRSLTLHPAERRFFVHRVASLTSPRLTRE